MSELTPAQLEEVRQAMANGNKIEAIKIYRGYAGCDLVTAKSFVERLRDQDNSGQGEMYNDRRKGCMGVLLLLCTAAIVCTGVAIRTLA